MVSIGGRKIVLNFCGRDEEMKGIDAKKSGKEKIIVRCSRT